MTNPELVRNVAVVGHLHHGKTIVRALCCPALGRGANPLQLCLAWAYGLRSE